MDQIVGIIASRKERMKRGRGCDTDRKNSKRPRSLSDWVSLAFNAPNTSCLVINAQEEEMGKMEEGGGEVMEGKEEEEGEQEKGEGYTTNDVPSMEPMDNGDEVCITCLFSQYNLIMCCYPLNLCITYHKFEWLFRL